MREVVRFLLGDELCELTSVDPTMTVLDWLRGPQRRVGTKEGCNEGDCGACTVVVASPHGQGLRYEAVNACIRFVATLDGCQLLTVEDLQGADGALHPIQEAIVQRHASQCGFCTPGFVMSIFAMSRRHKNVPDGSVFDDELAGNLCRCTGYAPIVQAAETAIRNGAAEDRFARGLARTAERLRALRDHETVRVGVGHRRFLAPATIDALAELVVENPDATILAGGTDVGLWVTKQLRRLDTVIWTGRVEALRRITTTDTSIEIGAGVTHSEAMAALAPHYPDIGEMWRRFGSVQVRNAGTVGGNIANGSPIGDASPALIATGATLHLRRGGDHRWLPLERFFLEYGRQDRARGELVERISVPLPKADTRYRAYKISKRFDQDISAVLGAFLIRLEAEQVVEARLAFGGMAGTPKRAAAAEACLVGQLWREATVREAMEALGSDFQPITDVRASAEYRLRMARNLLYRFFIETTDATAQTRLVGDRSLAHV